jgi:glycosyltransferase involved in cell wall biosynthesis
VSGAERYPRVLIIGEDFDMISGGGITMSCLFGDWPRDRIAVATGGRTLGQSGFAGHYYRLGALEDRWVWPLSAVGRESWKVSGPVTPAPVDHDDYQGAPPSSPDPRPATSEERPTCLHRRVGSAALRALGAGDLLRGLHLSGPFREWVAAFEPDLIYSQLSTLGLVRLVDELVRDTGIPLTLHFMDDWPSTAYRRGLTGPVLRRKLIPELKTLVARASVLMAISDDMAREFETRYSRPFLAFHNALELREWESARRTSWEAGSPSPFEVLYAGRIGTANEASMLDVAEAIGKLIGAGMSIRFTVVTPDSASPVAQALQRFPHVELSPAIAHREIPSRLAAADLLVLPLDFEGRGLEFARFSMPTKAVEYMASGTPTLVYAPAEHAVSRYAIAEGWAWVVGRRNGEELADGLRLLAEDGEKREHLARKAIETARAHHDAGTVREGFRSALCCARGQRTPK